MFAILHSWFATYLNLFFLLTPFFVLSSFISITDGIPQNLRAIPIIHSRSSRLLFHVFASIVAHICSKRNKIFILLRLIKTCAPYREPTDRTKLLLRAFL